jgi:hypothetical protein
MPSRSAPFVERLLWPAGQLLHAEPPEDPEKDVRRFLDSLFSYFSGVEFLTRFREACPVPGTFAQDYAPRRLHLESGQVIAWIQFFGLDTACAFVDVVAHSTARIDWSEVKHVLRREFSAFAPTTFRCWLQPGEAAPASDERHHGQRVVAGVLQHLPLIESASHVILEPATLSDYAAYTDVCNRLLEERPGTWEYLKPESIENIRKCIASEAWFRARVGPQVVGYIGAQRGDFRMLKGWVMVEKILDRPFRGVGLGAAMESQFLRQLPHSELPLVIGTIDVRNAESVRAALRVGRRIVETSCFVNLG